MARKYGPELQKKRVPPYPPPKSKMNRQVLFSFKKSFDHTSLGFWRGVWGEPNFLWNYFFVEQKRNWYFIFNSWSSTQIKLLGGDEWSQIEFIFQNPLLESIVKGPYFSAIAHTGTSPNSFCSFFIFSRFDIFLFFSKEFHYQNWIEKLEKIHFTSRLQKVHTFFSCLSGWVRHCFIWIWWFERRWRLPKRLVAWETSAKSGKCGFLSCIFPLYSKSHCKDTKIQHTIYKKIQ